MIRVVDNMTPETPETQAAAWVVRMREPVLEAHVERQFDLWISADARNAVAYADMLATYEVAGDIASQARPKPARNWGYWAGGAALLAACLVGAVVTVRGTDALRAPAPQHTATLATGPGETLNIPLPDGTQVALSGNSAVSIRYGSGERHVDLTRGEAYFDVARDEKRPFVVSVEKTEVRVLGTAFNIDLLADDRSEVSVYRGRVRVAANGRKQDLTVGEKVVSGPDGIILSRFDAAQGPDWREGWFDAEDISLARLVDELNRYAKRPIRLEGADLAHTTVSGRFKISDPDRVVSSLKAGYGLRSSIRNNVLVLTK